MKTIILIPIILACFVAFLLMSPFFGIVSSFLIAGMLGASLYFLYVGRGK